MSNINIGIVGASGLVGQKILTVMGELNINFNNLKLYTSNKSANKKISYKNKTYSYEELTPSSIDPNLDLVFFSCGASNALKYAPLFAKNKTYVVDNSSAFRNDPNLSLVIPEINAHCLKKNSYIVANPNCSTTQALLPLKVIDDLFNAIRVDYVTYQAVSGSGVKGIQDLKLSQNGLEQHLYPQPIADNVICEIGTFNENGFSDEELKMVYESQKILEKPTLEVSAMCVRVPVSNSHSVNLSVTCEQDIDIDLLNSKLKSFPNLKLMQLPTYPSPLIANNSNDVYVGRVRIDLFNPKKVHLICCSDNLRKGAATNTVQIGQEIISRFLTNEVISNES